MSIRDDARNLFKSNFLEDEMKFQAEIQEKSMAQSKEREWE